MKPIDLDDLLHPPSRDLPVACVASAVAPDERERWLAVGRAIYGAVTELRELPDGLALRLAPSALAVAGEYVSFDRRCCEFVHWTLVVEQAGGSVWLVVRGPDGIKSMFRETLESTDLLRVEVARAAGLTTHRRRPLAPQQVDELASSVNEHARRQP